MAFGRLLPKRQAARFELAKTTSSQLLNPLVTTDNRQIGPAVEETHSVGEQRESDG